MKVKYIISLLTTFLFSSMQYLNAQDAANSVKVIIEERTHPLIWMLLIIMLGLLVAIFILSRLYVKIVIKNISKITLILLPLLLFSTSIFSQEPTATPFKTEVVYQPISSFTAYLFGIGIGFEVLIILFFGWKLHAFLQQINVIETEEAKSYSIALPKFFDNINASVAIEKEKDIQMDHDYDGIHELDNDLPPWWKYSFYVSIVWAILYLGYYHLGDGELSIQSYEREMEAAKIEKAEILKVMASKVDESNVTFADASGIADGKTIFTSNCAACHGQSGEGNVGPNLTDDYWLHGGNLNSIYKTIKVGWPAKGMKSWEAELSPVQIKNIASYIKSIHGTNPANAKAPQGDLFSDSPAADGTAVAPKDSLSASTIDTTAKSLAKK